MPKKAAKEGKVNAHLPKFTVYLLMLAVTEFITALVVKNVY